MAKITIGTTVFKSKDEAKKFFRVIRDIHSDGETITEPYAKLLHGLIACHPEAASKIGCGIKYFTVETEPFYFSRHFVLHREDGTSTDFSFNNCVYGRKIKNDKIDALRSAIEPQISEFRNAQFDKGDVFCPHLKIKLTKHTCHVDHIFPITFLWLVNEWLKQEGIGLDDLKTTPSGDNKIFTELLDPQQKESWITFHKNNSSLRILSPSANLSAAYKSKKQ